MSTLTPSELEIANVAFYHRVSDQRSYRALDTSPELANDVIFIGVGLASTGPSTVGTWTRPQFRSARDFQVPRFNGTSGGELILTSSESLSSEPKCPIRVLWSGSTTRPLEGQVAIFTALQIHRLSTKHGIPIFKNLRTLETKHNKGPLHLPFNKGAGLTMNMRAQAFSTASDMGVRQCRHLLGDIVAAITSCPQVRSAEEETRYVGLMLATWVSSAQHTMDRNLAERIRNLYGRGNNHSMTLFNPPPRIVETKPDTATSDTPQDLEDLLSGIIADGLSPTPDYPIPTGGNPVPCPSIDTATFDKLVRWFQERHDEESDGFMEDLEKARKVWEDTATSQPLLHTPLEVNEGGAGPSTLPVPHPPPSLMVDQGGAGPSASPAQPLPPSRSEDNNEAGLPSTPALLLDLLCNGASDDLDWFEAAR